MTKLTLLPIVLAGMAVASLSCVMPEPMDQKVITRYQETMARKSPQARIQDGKLGPLRPAAGTSGPPLKTVTDPQTGTTQIPLSLDQAVMRTLANSLDIRVVSFDPQIAYEEVVKAAAEFDYTLVGGYSYESNDAPNNTADGEGRPLAGGKTNNRVWTFGAKQKTITGAQQSLAWTMTRAWDNSAFKLFNTSWQEALTYQMQQPLLRDAGPAVTLSKFHIAQVNQKISNAQFRQKVEETVTDAITTYWSLVQARRDYEIQDNLLKLTKETLQRVKDREQLDATQVQIKQAEASVESRWAVLIRAKKNIYDTQEKLARQMADPQINVLMDYEIVPTTPPVTTLIKQDIADQLLTGLAHNPVLEQARLAIDVANINVMVARNGELPRLDLTGSAQFQGFGPNTDRAIESFADSDFFSYSAGVQFEYTIGNRARHAELLSKEYSQLKAMTDMQNTADQMALLIKERIRQIQTNYEEIVAQRATIAAAAAQLQALEDTERFRGKLSPEFLELKLSAQETLANAQRSELLAIVQYNSTLVDLARATGTVLELQRVQVSLPVVLNQKPWPSSSAESMTAEPVGARPVLDILGKPLPSTDPSSTSTTTPGQ